MVPQVTRKRDVNLSKAENMASLSFCKSLLYVVGKPFNVIIKLAHYERKLEYIVREEAIIV